MASGLPVIAPNSGGLLDHVQHAQNGLLFEPERLDQFIESVDQLLRSPEQAQTLGRAVRQHAETFSWAGSFERLFRDYNDLVLNHNRGRVPVPKTPLPKPGPLSPNSPKAL